MKRILTLVLVLALAVASIGVMSSCALVNPGNATGDTEYVKNNNKLVVGVTIYEPMDYVDGETGEWAGFDAELAKMFAESLGVNCQLVIIDWNNKVAELKSKQIDLIWNGMTASDELGEQIDFSVSYSKNAQVAVAKKNSGITKDAIANATIAVENGSAGETVARETVGVADAKLTESSNGQVGALNEVVAGTSQVAIIDITMAQTVIGKGEYADLEIVSGASYGDEIFAVGLRKGSDLKAELDAFLKAKYADGTLTALATKYGVALNIEALQ